MPSSPQASLIPLFQLYYLKQLQGNDRHEYFLTRITALSWLLKENQNKK